MSKLYWRYSTMNAGKSLEVLKVYHNYIEQGKIALIFTSSHEDRFGYGYLGSRIGIKEKAIVFDENTNFYSMIKSFKNKKINIDCILIDEAQFMKENQVKQLRDISLDFKIPVLCYGIRTDFVGDLFEGSKALFAHSNDHSELKTICWFCNKKSVYNLRVENGKPIFHGEKIAIGDNANKEDKKPYKYVACCSRCYTKMEKTRELIRPILVEDPVTFKDKMNNKIWTALHEYQNEI